MFTHMSYSIWNLPKNMNSRKHARVSIFTGKGRHNYPQYMKNCFSLTRVKEYKRAMEYVNKLSEPLSECVCRLTMGGEQQEGQ